MNHHTSTLAKSAMGLLLLLQRPSFTQSYRAIICPPFILRKSFKNRTRGRRFQKRPSPPLSETAYQQVLASKWKEFYTRARAFHNKDHYGDPVDISQISDNVAKEIFKIETVEPFNFPKDDDRSTVDAACATLSNALQNVIGQHDTAEVKEALDNLRKVYNTAAESNTVSTHYIDIDIPIKPYSPLDEAPNPILLSRPWMRELITGLHNQSLRHPILVVGDPGSGEF